MEHPFGVGDSVQAWIERKGWVTGTIVALPERGGWWSFRLDGEATVRSTRSENLKPLAAPTQPIKRRDPPKERKRSSPKKKKKKKQETWPDAHRNELPKGCNGYDRNPDEDLTLPDEGASFQGNPTPPPFRRGRQIRKLPMSSDRWSPEMYFEKPPDCEKSFEQLCATWASEQDPADLEKWKSDCVWGWCPDMEPPPWWRIRFHEDDTYTVLCLCFVFNVRCYQPGLGQDFDEFLRVALKRDTAAKALEKVNKKLKVIAEDDWLKTHLIGASPSASQPSAFQICWPPIWAASRLQTSAPVAASRITANSNPGGTKKASPSGAVAVSQSSTPRFLMTHCASSPATRIRNASRPTRPRTPPLRAASERPRRRNSRSRATTSSTWRKAAAVVDDPRRAPAPRISLKSRQYALPRRASGRMNCDKVSSKVHQALAIAATSSIPRKPPRPNARPMCTWKPVLSFVFALRGGCLRAAAISINSSTSTASKRMTWLTTSNGKGASSWARLSAEGDGAIDVSGAAVHKRPQSLLSELTWRLLVVCRAPPPRL